jgi:hypothetical protein
VLRGLERVKGIEPSYAAWEAAVLPLNYTRGGTKTWIVVSACFVWQRLNDGEKRIMVLGA